MFNVTGWVRKLFRDAALAGIRDAMEAVQPEEGATAPTLGEMRGMLEAATGPKSLPAAKDEEPAKKSRVK